MSLAAGKAVLRSDLIRIYKSVGVLRSAADLADKKGRAIHKFFISGVPSTTLTFVTSSTPNGTGLGGFDTTTPGGGLPAAHQPLIDTLTDIYYRVGISVEQKATLESQAIYDYYSQAIIRTIDVATPHVGPDAGTGGLIAPTPGASFSATLSPFIAELRLIHESVSTSAAAQARREGNAIHSFAVTGSVVTAGTRSGTSGTATGSVS